MATASEKLLDLLGFNPDKESMTADVLSEAMQEIKAERAVAAKAKAKEQLIKAMELHKQHQAARREFEGKSKKFEKELGALIGQLQAVAAGQNPPPQEPEPESQEAAAS